LATSVSRRRAPPASVDSCAGLRIGRLLSGIQEPTRITVPSARRAITRARGFSKAGFARVDYCRILPQAARICRFGHRRFTARITRGSLLHDAWLNVPQAVLLEFTGNLRLAREFEADDPNLLVIKAILRLPPLISIDVDASLNEMGTVQQRYRAAVESRAQESAYANGLRRVHAKLVKGVTTKGSRAPDLPLEVIDPAEFARLELRGIDAVHRRTGEAVWYNLAISAPELVGGNQENACYDKSYTHSPPPNCLVGGLSVGEVIARSDTPLAKEAATPLPDRDLRSWYQQRVQEAIERKKTASGEADWEAVRLRYPGRVTRARLRALRNEMAPENWKKQGRRSSPAAG